MYDQAPHSPGPPPGPRDPAGLAALLDPGTLRPIGSGGGGVQAVWGRVQGVGVVAFRSDARTLGGTLGSEGCDQIVRGYDVAVRERMPIIGVWHSGGARLAEGVESLDAVGRVFAAMTRASGYVPQLSVVVGPPAGGAAYGPALTDIVVLADSGRTVVTGERMDREPLGRGGGVAHVVTGGEAQAYQETRRLAALLGHQGLLGPEVEESGLAGLLPGSARRAYDVRPLVDGLLDEPGVELQPWWAPNMVTTLGRFAGRTVGVVANNPLRLGGCLDALSAEKSAQFVRMCDAFGVPLIVLVDVPGYLSGLTQEHESVVRRGAKLLHAFAECSVPRVTVVIRKAYGGAYIAMNSRSLGATRVLAWPETEIAATSAGGLGRALELGVVDEVVEPGKTRGAVRRALAEAVPQRGAHGNIPL